MPTIAPRCPPAARTVARSGFQQQARTPAPACRRDLIACSCYPRLARLQIIIPYILSRYLFRLRRILKDHLAFSFRPMHLPPITPPDKRDTVRPAGVPESKKEREKRVMGDWLPSALCAGLCKHWRGPCKPARPATRKVCLEPWRSS
jgi:hypothetical protein